MINKPFIFNFIEYFKPERSTHEYTEYSSALNLNVLKGTKTPATCVLNLEGETFTKAHQDVTDLSTNLKAYHVKLMDNTDLCFTAQSESNFELKTYFSQLYLLLLGETNTRSFQETTDVK